MSHYTDVLGISHPETPYAVPRIAFCGAITVRQRCFAFAETLAHLEHLQLEGRAKPPWRE